MLYAVAARFSDIKTAEELGLTDLRFWYEGHEIMCAEERAALGGTVG
jgi:hypothetical protein